MTMQFSKHMRTVMVAVLSFGVAGIFTAIAQEKSIVLERDGRTVVLEPYAPNILRITLSKSKPMATSAPGYGFIGTPSMTGWTHEKAADGGEVVKSSRMVLHLSPAVIPDTEKPQAMKLDELNESLRDHYFGGGPHHPEPDDMLIVTTPDGKTLVDMRNWRMRQNKVEDEAPGSKGEDPGSRVSATFATPVDEHFYGLGQQQQGWLDLRDHELNCWHDYNAPGGETLCIPFMVSTKGYGFVWDNPSKTTIKLGFNQQNVWTSDIGDRVSFFVIAGDTTDEIYSGYRLLTGTTHMLPKAAYGYIQSKAIYPTQEQALDVAKQYRARQLPLDILVVDFLNMTRQGELDLDPKRWPDAAAMNDQLHAMGVDTLLSVWPHFSEGTQFYDMLKAKGWLIHKPDGTPDSGNFKSVIGPNIDTTNPEAANWWWEAIRDRYIKPDHFDYLWLDETEPDVDPINDVFHVGSGPRFYNVYPLFHTAASYDGMRRDFPDKRVMSLVRAAYLGAQRNGAIFWSSDIVSTWDMFKRSIPAGLNFTATGMPYWDTDIAGFFSPSLPGDYKPAHTPLIDPSDVRDNIGRYSDYPELFVRWFQWGTFQPVMRAHGEREHNEVWAYGKQATPILGKYLRLRYELMPYIYSLGYNSYKTGAPYTRALFMDFPNDTRVLNIPDEYMFGPAFLVAPVTEQGATKREVYLPAGTDWFNYWTAEKIKGGQTITVDAPIDTLPLFVKAGSIIPLGSTVLSTKEKQSIKSVRIYPGANANFTLFTDDGLTYSYEKGAGSITQLNWDEASHKLHHDGAAPWSGPDTAVVNIVGR